MWRSTAEHIRSLDEALVWRANAVGPVVFTNGVFDLLHAGHIHVLEQARALGAVLIVGLNSDASVRRLGKGADRPIVAEADRARILAALACVDCVVLFDAATPLTLIEALTPDVLVKGGDYTPASVVGADVVTARGGRVEIVPLLPHLSTTALVERLRGSS
ncbi:MAG TPA: D-glycero-beta-D-manno-heptose 1-phosphate adenylyltransferase [Gemmatimonadales bacterium]|nr:D-glycero-beta-D-manno-heptose 1-phosphate adenylyltransferase [Gemmatimonadales bacterium]